MKVASVVVDNVNGAAAMVSDVCVEIPAKSDGMGSGIVVVDTEKDDGERAAAILSTSPTPPTV